jgi:hypothetical protein
VNANTRRLLHCLLDEEVKKDLGETTTADVVPPLVMPGFKIKSLQGKDDDDEDEDDTATESRSIVDAVLEDCPCNIIPDDATPTDGTDNTAKKPEDKAAEGGTTPSDDAMKVVLGGSDSKKPVETSQVESKMPASREDVLHRMAYLTKPGYQQRLQRELHEAPAPRPIVEASAASICHSIGASAPSAAMPTGKDEDAEKALKEASAPAPDMAGVVASATNEGIPMPEHKAGDGRKITEAFRKFVRA